MFNIITKKGLLILLAVSTILSFSTVVCAYEDEVPDDYDAIDAYSEILEEDIEESEEFYDEQTDDFYDSISILGGEEYSDFDGSDEDSQSDFEELSKTSDVSSDVTDSSTELYPVVLAETKQVIDYSISGILDKYGDSQELYDRYTYYLFYPEELELESENEDYELTAREEASYAAAEDSELTAFLFSTLREMVQEVALGNRSHTVLSIQYQDLKEAGFYWSCEELGVESTDLRRGEDAVYEILLPVFKNVSSSLAAESPFELFWYNRREGTQWEYEAEFDEEGQLCIKSLCVSMPVAAEYRDPNRVDEKYCINQAKMLSAYNSVKNADTIAAQYIGEDDLSKLRAYAQIILDLADYGNNEDYDYSDYDSWSEFFWDYYGSAKQLIAVFDGDPETKADCEGYTKAFQYLCERPEGGLSGDTKCISVKGDRNEQRHMWNIVRMSNGRNYLVDLPFCDSGVDSRFFLAGTDIRSRLNGREYKYMFYEDGEYGSYIYDKDTLSHFDDSLLAISPSDYPSIDLAGESNITVTVPSAKYTGKAVKPKPVVKVGSTVLINGADYIVSYKNNIAVGSGEVTITGIRSYEGTITKSFKIQALGSINKASVGNIVKKVYSGKAQKQSPIVKINGKTLKADTDYTLSYKTNINAGRAAVVIKGKGGYTGSQIQYFAIIPQTSQITSLKAGNKQFKAVWQKKAVQTSGYQLQYSTDKSFKTGRKVLTFYNTGKTSETVKNLKKNKIYYVRLRTFKKANGKAYFSKWSTVKKVKVL